MFASSIGALRHFIYRSRTALLSHNVFIGKSPITFGIAFTILSDQHVVCFYLHCLQHFMGRL
ncbi:CLUMA_CG014243, isoform E [Clunio marinus]|uniref:CLUMA_CG014243, isoform E n=1 Tax=Clunio marinus TaxID=568069 RepID=A0A1J1IR14_9DIPT|nr:CLUMA_CG014243, isoform E [Clunio marinus]